MAARRAAGRSADARPRGFVFVDLVGFTAATDVHGDTAPADLAARLQDAAARNLTPRDAVVKSIGDAVLCVSDTAASAVDLAERIVDELESEDQFLAVSCGITFGTAVRQRRDYFGAAVNLAARLADLAGAGQILCTRSVADAASAAGRVLAPLGDRSVKNLSAPIEVFEIERVVDVPAVTDPVCQMRVDPRFARGGVEVSSRTYQFCSVECRRLFLADPSAYST